jgi:hypothetical protein
MHIHMAMTAVPYFPEFCIRAVSTETGIIVNSLRWLRAEGPDQDHRFRVEVSALLNFNDPHRRTRIRRAGECILDLAGIIS